VFSFDFVSAIFVSAGLYLTSNLSRKYITKDKFHTFNLNLLHCNLIKIIIVLGFCLAHPIVDSLVLCRKPRKSERILKTL